MRGVLVCAALAAMGLTACERAGIGAKAAQAVPEAAPKPYDLDAMIASARAADQAARTEPARQPHAATASFAPLPADESALPAQAASAAPLAGFQLTNLRVEGGMRGGPAGGSLDLYGIGRRNAERTRAAQQAVVEAAVAAPAAELGPTTLRMVDEAGNVTVLSAADGFVPPPPPTPEMQQQIQQCFSGGGRPNVSVDAVVTCR